MIPYILAAVGGYLIGDSLKGKQFAEGGYIGSIKSDVQVGGYDIYTDYNQDPYETSKDRKYVAFVIDFEDDIPLSGAFATREEAIEDLKEEYQYYFDKGILTPTESYQNSLKGKQFANGGMMAKGGKTESESIREHYIEFLNKKKGFTRDKKEFASYEDAIKWGRKNLENFNSDMVRMEYADGGIMARGGEFKPYGKTKGKFKLEYKIDGEPQSEIWETKEMVEDSAKRYSKIGYTDIKITQLNNGGKMAKKVPPFRLPMMSDYSIMENGGIMSKKHRLSK